MNKHNPIDELIRQLSNIIRGVTAELESGLRAQYARNPSQFRNVPSIYKPTTLPTVAVDSWDNNWNDSVSTPPWSGEWDNTDS